ncbi:MAG: GNAT family N-acetyltransferase [Candidatus Omnitrophica bacterium]|nr:GNAT family N-acetyltransferase [Candidatus Omnitrophota bacterium]
MSLIASSWLKGNGAASMYKAGLTTQIYRSIDEVAPVAWGSIFPDVPEGYEFYKVVEAAFLDEYTFYYVTIFRGDQIVCLVPAFVTTFALDTTVKGPLKSFTGSLRRRFPRLLDVKILIAGSPLSGGKLGVADQDQPDIARTLDEAISSLAQRENINLVAFKDFHQTQTLFLDCLLKHRFHRIRSFPSVNLDINFTSFDDYLAGLSKPTRKGLKKKFRDIDAQPLLKNEVQDSLGELLGDAYQLYLNTLQKSEIQFEVLPKSFFEQISARMPGKTKFFLWKLDGKLVAFDLCLVSGDQMVDEYIGLDYGVAYQYHLYFDTYRVIIKWCLAHGIRNYEAGALNYEPKKRLDFAFTSQYIYVKHRNPVINILFGLLGCMLKPENFDPVLKSMRTDMV